MTPRELIAEAWKITMRERKLRRWGFFSSFFETFFDLKLVSYQAFFLWEYLRGHGGAGFFDVEIAMYHHWPHWAFWTFVITLVILITIELFVPHLAAGAIIGLAAKSSKGEKVNGGLVLALYNFFPIFTIHEFFILGHLATVVTAISVVLRYIQGSFRGPIIIGILVLWMFTNILKFFFTFAEEAVVISKVGIFHAMGKSFKLLVSYLSHIMFILILLFVISIRIVINAIMILLLPAIALGLGLLLAMVLPPVVSYSIAAAVGLALLVLFSYFIAYLHVFKQTVWTLLYIELSAHKDLDIIEG
jgi:hypothetical protein